jgi:hypothetical protein
MVAYYVVAYHVWLHHWVMMLGHWGMADVQVPAKAGTPQPGNATGGYAGPGAGTCRGTATRRLGAPAHPAPAPSWPAQAFSSTRPPPTDQPPNPSNTTTLRCTLHTSINPPHTPPLTCENTVECGGIISVLIYSVGGAEARQVARYNS